MIFTRSLVTCMVLFCADTEWTAEANYINVALGKPTSQSGTVYGGYSENAVDGNSDPVYYGSGTGINSCIHTDQTHVTWWMVDLLIPYSIYTIAITNRATGMRFKDFYIYVSDVNPLPISPHPGSILVGETCLHYEGIFPVSGPHSIHCDKVIKGRYVYIYKFDSDSLIICEFEVLIPSEDAAKQQPSFKQRVGKRDGLSPFYSTILEVPWVLKCVATCVERSEEVATLVQMQPSTGRCECLQYSGFEILHSPVILDDEWITMEMA